MATIDENLKVWDGTYDWQAGGDEWSAAWGNPTQQWYSTILPRIHRFVPPGTILEIAPGFGRWTSHLKDLCKRLVLVDLSGKCIEHCKARFAAESKIAYHVNDGISLEMVADGSIDFVFSFDALVHVEADVIQNYLFSLAQKLKPTGAGFLHHSNAGWYKGRVAMNDHIQDCEQVYRAVVQRLDGVGDLKQRHL